MELRFAQVDTILFSSQIGLEKHIFFFTKPSWQPCFIGLEVFVFIPALTVCKNLDTNLEHKSLSFVFLTCKMGIVVQNHIVRIKLFKAQGDSQGKMDITLMLVLFSIYE